MLTGPRAAARRTGGPVPAAALATAVLTVCALSATSARADAPVYCPPSQTICLVKADTPAGQSFHREVRPVRAGGDGACRVPAGRPNSGQVVPCTSAELGSWNNADGCYYRLLQPQPPRSEPEWEGHPDGAIYETACPGIPGTGGGWVWRATPPAGARPVVDPAVLAQQAVRQLDLEGPAIRMAPPVGSMGLVHVPVWLWTSVTPTTWGPASATASVPGLSVTAVARAVAVRWDLGDGHTVTCSGPGTAYRPGQATASPTCGHTYTRSSAGRPGDAYPVTATTTWQVTWTGGGQTGQLTVTRTSRTNVRIAEMQALT